VIALGAASAALAVVGTDVLHWRDAVSRGDAAFARDPSSAVWRPSTVLPSRLTRSLLGLGLALRFRAAEQSFAAVRAAGEGYDNGLSESRTRGEVEGALSDIARSSDRTIASQAANLLGILAFVDATRSGPVAPAPVDQSVADFQAAVRLDPTNADAKFNLERLLHELIAHGVRVGPNAAPGGPTKGHQGAAGGLPGRGY
jgi:hypothetical protein